jgi:hypothetical protein
MPGPTLEQKLAHLTERLAEAEQRYAAGEPYPDHVSGTWPGKIAEIKGHIADIREMLASE